MKTTVNYVSVSQPLAELVQAANKLSSVISDVQSIYSNVSYYTGLGLNTKANLKKAITDIGDHCSDINQLYKAGNQAMIEYYICENRLAGNDISEGSSELAAAVKSSQPINEVNWSPLISVIGQLGTIGGITGAMLSVANNPESVGNSIVKIVGTGAVFAAKVSDGSLIDLWGTSTVDAIGFSENLAKKLDGYIINNPYNSKNTSVAAKNAANVGAVAKWGGIAISGMLNFADNFEEYNADFSNPRLYAETIGETAVDAGLGIFVGAGVAALAGATAPVWAVGVVTTGVILGLDWASEKITGKNVSELISDAVWDTAEATGELIKKAEHLVGNAVNATVDRISAGWKKFKRWF